MGSATQNHFILVRQHPLPDDFLLILEVKDLDEGISEVKVELWIQDWHIAASCVACVLLVGQQEVARSGSALSATASEAVTGQSI